MAIIEQSKSDVVQKADLLIEEAHQHRRRRYRRRLLPALALLLLAMGRGSIYIALDVLPRSTSLSASISSSVLARFRPRTEVVTITTGTNGGKEVIAASLVGQRKYFVRNYLPVLSGKDVLLDRIVVGSTIYVSARDDGPPGQVVRVCDPRCTMTTKSWLAWSAKSISANNPFNSYDPITVMNLVRLSAAAPLKIVGHSILDGTRTTQYSTTITPGDTRRLKASSNDLGIVHFLSSPGLDGQRGKVDLWTDKHGVARKLIVTYPAYESVPAGPVRILVRSVMTFSDFNASVPQTRPANNEVLFLPSGTYTWSTVRGSGSAGTPK